MARRKLTDQQKARIAKIQEQRLAKAQSRADDALANAEESAALTGRVVIRHGQSVVIEKDAGEQVLCLFRQNLGDVVCGDRVLWHATEDDQGVVTAVQPRDTTLARPDYSGREKPIAANITQLFVVLAPEPEPSGYLLDQYLITSERIGVKATIVLNKADLMTDEQRQAFFDRFAHYPKLGYPIIQASAKTKLGLQPLYDAMNGHTNILVGQSGVGKSSLINALMPEHTAEEGQISEATGYGRHTTSTATLYHLPSGGEMIDSPGVRSFRLTEFDRRTLELGYPEIRDLIGQCKFNNCSHHDEPNCAVQAAAENGEIHPDRLASFLNMAEQATN